MKPQFNERLSKIEAVNKKIIPFVLLLSLIGCIEEDNVSDRSLRGRWYLTSMRLSQPVDLNRDGVASLDMASEFGCLYDENILISHNGNNFTLNNASLFYDSASSGYYCDGNAEVVRNFGDVEKVDEHTIRLHFVNENPEYAVEYTLFNDVLSKTYTTSYPTAYDNATQTWTYGQLSIRKEYRRDD